MFRHTLINKFQWPDNWSLCVNLNSFQLHGYLLLKSPFLRRITWDQGPKSLVDPWGRGGTENACHLLPLYFHSSLANLLPNSRLAPLSGKYWIRHWIFKYLSKRTNSSPTVKFYINIKYNFNHRWSCKRKTLSLNLWWIRILRTWEREIFDIPYNRKTSWPANPRPCVGWSSYLSLSPTALITTHT